MKRTVLLTLLALGAVVAPTAAAHVIFASDTNGDGECDTVTGSVGDPRTAPHAVVWEDCTGGVYHPSTLP